MPVRNEVERLPRLLGALVAQLGAPRFTLCLFLDSCTDGSVELVAEAAQRLPFPVAVDCRDAPGEPNAGRARRCAMALAAAAAPGGVLLTTDADGEPAPDWVAGNLAALAAAEVVAGRIVRGSGPRAPLQDRIERYYDRLHALRRSLDPVPWEGCPTHHWTSGASLALRTDVYAALGGFPAIARGEDAALCDAAMRAGYRVRRDGRVVVRTSARRAGRAVGGLATLLAAQDGGGAPPLVSHPEDEAWRYRMHRAARESHGGDPAPLARALHLGIGEVAQLARACRNGEAFAARIVGAPPGGMRPVTLGHAEAVLATLEGAALEGAA